MKKTTFNILSWTWGLPMTLLGLIVAIILIATGNKPHRFGYCIYFTVGKWWGGQELGFFFMCDESDNESVKCHEFGHAIQNCYWGILMPFVICIPSAIRYWYRRYLTNVKKIPESTLPDYDSIWFEGQATRLGKEYMKNKG